MSVEETAGAAEPEVRKGAAAPQALKPETDVQPDSSAPDVVAAEASANAPARGGDAVGGPDVEPTDATHDVEAVGPISDGAEVAAQPTTSLVDESAQPETFIPVSRFALIERLCDPQSWPDGDTTEIRELFYCLGAIRNLTYTKRLLDLKQAYLPFSPDRDTVRAMTYTADQFTAMQHRLTGLLGSCLEGANYKQITPQILEEIFEEKSAYGLDLEVDLKEFDEVMIYSRGSTVKSHQYRTWKSLWLRKATETVPIFQRLFLLLKLKSEAVRVREVMLEEDIPEDKAIKQVRKLRRMLPEQASSDFVYLKMFKQIPRADLQMMFPNTKVRFRLKDKLFLGLTAGGGTLASIVTTASKLALVFSNPVKAIGALVGLIAVVIRQAKKFLTQKNQYMMTLAQNLYFHTLADNRGVLTLLADRAEEEDVKEEMLLYALLVRGPLAQSELDEAKEAIEQFIMEEFKVLIDFDLHDALGRLTKEGLVREADNGDLITLSPSEASAHLRKTWSAHLENIPTPPATAAAA